MSSMGSSEELYLPPGFRFHPTDEELVIHYLLRRCGGHPIPAPIIAEVDLYKFDPWELPELAKHGEKEWYFFSPRDRKYPNGSRPNRAAGTGYWKATGADKPIGSPKTVAIKKALVFYAGKPPKGVKTNWIMHEYRLADVDRSARKTNKNNSNNLRLDDWVLCRLYNKKGIIEKHSVTDGAATAVSSPKTPPSDIIQAADPKTEAVDQFHHLPRLSPGLFYIDWSSPATAAAGAEFAQVHTDSSDHSMSPDSLTDWDCAFSDAGLVIDGNIGDSALFNVVSPSPIAFGGDAFFGSSFSYFQKPF